MARPSSKGAYAPLGAQYYLDDAILEAGPEAELLWVRILSFLASVPTDGFITERQLKTVGVNLRNVPRRVQSLTQSGLLVTQSGGYLARSWLKWNRSAAEVGRHLKADRERKASKQAELDPNSARIPESFRTDSGLKSSTEQSSTEQNRTNNKAVLDSLFDEAWNGWPKKVDRSDARKRFETATRKVTPVELAATIRRFGDAYAATTDKQYTPALGAWLNRERWTDELPTGTSSGSTRGQENLAIVAKYAALENNQLGIDS